MKKSVIAITLAAASSLLADVTMPKLFSDHAVLQRSNATAVFGKADVGEKVSVNYAGVSASTVADKDGKWLVRLDLSKDDGKSKTLEIRGKNTISIKDVITGDVWLASGQSNMAFKLENSLDADKFIKSSANPALRVFKVVRHASLDAAKGRCEGFWRIASPAETGSFSAVAYHFGRKVYAETKQNIGLLTPAWGSSSIEAWMSYDSLMNNTNPAAAKIAKKFIDDYVSYDEKLAVYVKKYEKWLDDCKLRDSAKSSAPPADAKWVKRETVFGNIKGGGILWFRKNINFTAEDTTVKRMSVWLGCPNAPAEFYLDGKKLGTFSIAEAKSGEFFKVMLYPPKLGAGNHEFLVKVDAAEDTFSFGRSFYLGTNHNNFTGWEMCRESDYVKLTKAQRKARPAAIPRKKIIQQLPTAIWNGTLSHFVPYTLKGAIWYQGETNCTALLSVHYADHLRAFIEQLRREFQNPGLPFYAVQLPSYTQKSADPADAGYWPEVRRGQEIVSKTVPNTALAAIIDYGEAGDSHPLAKQPVGERLANIALANVYGKTDVQWKNPTAVKAEKNGSSVKVFFEGTYGGLEAHAFDEYYWVKRSKGVKAKLVRNTPDTQVEGFAVCGKDGKWFWADKADIDGDCVIVSSSKVQEPAAVRYAWQNNPTCNLYSKAGLPVSSFRFELK